MSGKGQETYVVDSGEDFNGNSSSAGTTIQQTTLGQANQKIR
jgi:hypothetical protein